MALDIGVLFQIKEVQWATGEDFLVIICEEMSQSGLESAEEGDHQALVRMNTFKDVVYVMMQGRSPVGDPRTIPDAPEPGDPPLPPVTDNITPEMRSRLDAWSYNTIRWAEGGIEANEKCRSWTVIPLNKIGDGHPNYNAGVITINVPFQLQIPSGGNDLDLGNFAVNAYWVRGLTNANSGNEELFGLSGWSYDDIVDVGTWDPTDMGEDMTVEEANGFSPLTVEVDIEAETVSVDPNA